MIHYLIGDATEPQGDGPKIIAHICNSIGRWGAGFTGALTKKWKEPEEQYRLWYKYGNSNFDDSFKLGNVQLITLNHTYLHPELDDITIVANMIAQEGIGPQKTEFIDHVTMIASTITIPPIRYDALKKCLEEVNMAAINNDATIHMPRIGTNLAGGDWNIIEKIIFDTLSVEVYVYDLPK